MRSDSLKHTHGRESSINRWLFSRPPLGSTSSSPPWWKYWLKSTRPRSSLSRSSRKPPSARRRYGSLSWRSTAGYCERAGDRSKLCTSFLTQSSSRFVPVSFIKWATGKGSDLILVLKGQDADLTFQIRKMLNPVIIKAAFQMLFFLTGINGNWSPTS